MRTGRLAVARTPLLGCLNRPRQQLLDHHGQHELPQHGHEACHSTQGKHLDIEHHGQFLFTHPGIDLRGGHGAAGRIGDALVPMLLIQVGPQIDFMAAERLAFERHGLGRQKRIRVWHLGGQRQRREILQPQRRQLTDQLIQLPDAGEIRADFLAQGGIGRILGELPEVIRVVGGLDELTEKGLIRGWPLDPGGGRARRGEAALQSPQQLCVILIALERVIRVLGHIEDRRIQMLIIEGQKQHTPRHA